VILVICLNPALDITHHVPAVDWAGVNRPSSVHARPGGKGLNVARTLHALEADVLAMGLTGGITGAGVEAALAGLRIPAAFTQIAGETRRTFTVVDGLGGRAAAFNEAGPLVGAEEFAVFRDQYEKALARAAAVVLSGSLPPGLPDGTYATLVETAAAAGVPAVLDAHGEALLRGAAAGPAIVKPNLAELEALAGRRLSAGHGADMTAVAAAAGQLRTAGAKAVVASLGPEGLLAATGEGHWQARPPAPVAGNPTGAGDAVAAALVHGLVLGRPWDERLRHAVALGAATAAAPVAGEFRHADYASVLGTVAVRRHRDEDR
jgi:tagatose 6-phosphate kinase